MYKLLICSAQWLECQWQEPVLTPYWAERQKWHSIIAESIATLPPFGPIVGHKWFFQISSQWESQKNRFAFLSFGKIQILPPCIGDLPFILISLWRVKSSFTVNWFGWNLPLQSPCNSLIGYSLMWRCCSMPWHKFLLSKTVFDRLERHRLSFRLSMTTGRLRR